MGLEHVACSDSAILLEGHIANLLCRANQTKLLFLLNTNPSNLHDFMNCWFQRPQASRSEKPHCNVSLHCFQESLQAGRLWHLSAACITGCCLYSQSKIRCCTAWLRIFQHIRLLQCLVWCNISPPMPDQIAWLKSPYTNSSIDNSRKATGYMSWRPYSNCCHRTQAVTIKNKVLPAMLVVLKYIFNRNTQQLSVFRLG